MPAGCRAIVQDAIYDRFVEEIFSVDGTFVATADQRRTVRAMAGFGVPQEDIATFLDIDPRMLLYQLAFFAGFAVLALTRFHVAPWEVARSARAGR